MKNFNFAQQIIIVRLIFLALISFLLLIPLANAFALGHAPNVIDFGEISPGNKKVTNLYIMSNHDKELLVGLSSAQAPFHVYDPNHPKTYNFDSFEASQEDVSSWIEFVENPVLVPTQSIYFPNVKIWANKKTTLVLKVPKDAEPGYHAGTIVFSPRLVERGVGYGVGIITLSQPLFIFKVPGRVVRSAEIVDFISERIREEESRITIVVKNNGTVTIAVKADPVEISKGGNFITSLKTGYTTIKPGDTGMLYAFWPVGNLTTGIYEISVEISWLTGNSTRDGMIELSPFVPVAPPQPAPKPFPYWLLIIPLVLIALYLIYRYYKE